MFTFRKPCRVSACLLANSLIAAVVCISAQPVLAQAVAEAQSEASSSRFGDDSLELGVAITDSPGQGVLVETVAIGSPAYAVGIVPGDFLMSVGGKPIETPADLTKMVQENQAGQELKIEVWRNGRSRKLQVVPATSSDAPVQHQRAWLGVLLDATSRGGARIAQVIPGSPAAKAKLQAGDTITAIDATPIESAEDLIAAIEQFKPDATVAVTLKRDQETARKITLGSMAEASPLYPHGMPPVPLRPGVGELLGPDEPLGPVFPWVERFRSDDPRILQDEFETLREQMNQLRKDLRSLRRRRDRDDDVQHAPVENPRDGEPESSDAAELKTIPPEIADQILAAPPQQAPSGQHAAPPQGATPRHGAMPGQRRVEREPSRIRSYKRPGYGYGYQFGPGYRYQYRYYRAPYPVYGRRPYPYYYRYYWYPTSPYTRYYYGYYRPGIQIYVGPYGVRYYYR